MILLDTNVISKPLKPEGDPAVLDWLDQQNIETLYLTAISVAELRFGIAALPLGKRKRHLEDDFEQRILSHFDGRVLPFELSCTAALRSDSRDSQGPRAKRSVWPTVSLQR